LQFTATENAAQGHTTIDEEEAAVAMNWQPATQITMDPIIADPMRTLRTNSVTYYRRGGLEKVHMNETPIIFLRKRYGSAVVHSQS
jgi:hypothetical protein